MKKTTKSTAQQFADFKIRNNLSNSQIQQIIIEYANTPMEKARSYFKEKYQISEHVFYKMRDFAIICLLVDNSTVNLLQKKAIKNYSANNPKNTGAVKSINHFNYLLKKREEFLNSFTSAEIQDIAIKYASGIPVYKIAISYEICEYAIQVLLRKGIETLIVSKDILNTITLRVGDSHMENMLKNREKNKQYIISALQKEIQMLEFRIKCASFYPYDTTAIENLFEQLGTAKANYEKSLRL